MLNNIKLSFAAISLTAMSLASAQAATSSIVLHNTGVDSTGAPLAAGSADPFWTVVAGPDITTPHSAYVVTNQHPSSRYFEVPDARWISVSPGSYSTTHTTYTYELSFDLTGMDPKTASIEGYWGADNYGSIFLNGAAAIGNGWMSLPTGDVIDNYNYFHGFNITDGFVAGINRLSFTVTDVGAPSGLNVSGLRGTAISTAVPEASSPALVLAGVGTVAWVMRRRRKA